MTRAIRFLATAADVAALLAYAVASAFEAIDRALTTYTTECPDLVPADWTE